ncbi:hypothetical protein NLG97_g10332 [Lecanicillium saksenae]|uniref:Uncharacterized protein n=1 Tax=Lecanicillium saksenae TaxID=468837 RepID=A0ACC1QF71_9HYPO|nr:hypothetical protein NLG97_g10332 [Lecanicillium saksenae]
MKLLAILVLAAAGVMAAPKHGSPPPTNGQCIKYTPGTEPGSWVALGCATFQIPPGSNCKVIPGKKGAPYPKCIDGFKCPEPKCP